MSHNVLIGSETSGIEVKDGSNANLIADNVIDGAGASETLGGGIFLHGVRNNTISHNLVQNTEGLGIGVLNWDEATLNVANVVESNVVRNTARTAIDSGAIYVLGRSGANTGMVISGNVVSDVGTPDHHAVGIYLDDSTSGVVVSQNLVRGVGSDAVQIHGGRDNIISNNLFDLGAGRPSAVLFQAAPADTNPANIQTGNVVLQNVVLSTNSSPRLYMWYDGGTPLVSRNFYAVARGFATSHDAQVFDLNPAEADPGLASDSVNGYRRVQRASAIIGFKPIDLTGAGPRPASER